ncbi:PAS domain S-box-containing protein [Desulfacinum infernum DSM 9756]|uniref:histidine kinase n=1 Tax=Desulfacinum infernum DSM 9756 TaxID=1121391 RepID=A0A1M5HQK6_9BACT|nr:PAS domain S-box protein [Desulfacinum infernum]SHG18254.1 PAS domain S-box-containing protein [Desulfacinum infernum DSM 9756]
MRRILIVDDEAPVRALVAKAMEKVGYECTAAASAEQARKILETETFDLVMSDVNMPGESGLDFIQYVVRAHPDTATLLVSVMDDPAVARRALDLGVYGYIVKPFDLTAIQIDVESALRRRDLEVANRRYREDLEALVAERTRELLRQKEEYALLVKTLPCVVYVGNPDWTVTFVSERVMDITGYPPEAFLSGGKRWHEMILEEDLPLLRAAVKKALKEEGAFVREYRIQDAKGRERWIQDRGQIVRKPDGGIDYMSGVIFDITAQKRAEEALERAKEEWERTFDAVPDLIAVMDKNLHIEQVNRAFRERVSGLESDLVGKPCYTVLHDRDRMCDKCPSNGGHREERVYETEVYNKKLKAYFHATSAPIPDSQGNVTGYVSVLRDITRQKKAEEALKSAHRELDQLFSAISSVLIGLDAEGRVLRWNKMAEDVFGLNSEDVVGRDLDELGIDWQWDRVRQAMACCRAKKKSQRVDDLRYTRVDGQPGFLGLNINPVELDQNRGMGLLVMGAEITHRKLLESQLAQAQKLESIGQLAAGIAHEINTPTQFIGDNVRFLQDAFTDLADLMEKYRELCSRALTVEELREAAEAVTQTEESLDVDYLLEEIPQAISQSLEGVQRVARIVLAMKEFSHPGQEEKVPLDINHALENTLTVARNEWKYVADVVTDFDPTLPPVPCIPAELNQVFLNIIVNAAHAIKDALDGGRGEKGTITVTTRYRDDVCEVRISDTGTGIPKHIRHRIFDPFFTTKEVGKGTGQGLAISHSVIVDKHGGRLSFETEEGKGTTFIIEIPLE